MQHVIKNPPYPPPFLQPACAVCVGVCVITPTVCLLLPPPLVRFPLLSFLQSHKRGEERKDAHRLPGLHAKLGRQKHNDDVVHESFQKKGASIASEREEDIFQKDTIPSPFLANLHERDVLRDF